MYGNLRRSDFLPVGGDEEDEQLERRQGCSIVHKFNSESCRTCGKNIRGLERRAVPDIIVATSFGTFLGSTVVL